MVIVEPTWPRLSVVAKPDLDDGYLMVAHELLAAVMVAHVPQESRLVLFEVFAQIYGPAKAKHATLRPVEIARRTGLKPNNVSRAITWLIDHGMLRRIDLSTFAFVKNYDLWQGEGKSVLPPTMACYAANAPGQARRYGFAKITHNPEVSPKENRKKPIEVDIKSTDSTSSETSADSDLISKSMRKDINFDTIPPYREKENVVVVVEDDANDSRIVSDQNSTPDIRGQRPFKPDPAELDRVKATVDALDPMAFLTLKVEAIKTLYPLDWIEAAFIKAAGQANHGHLAHYANTLLIAAWRKGRWDEPEAFEPKPAHPQATPDRPATAPRLTPFQAKQKRIQDYLKAEAEKARIAKEARCDQ